MVPAFHHNMISSPLQLLLLVRSGSSDQGQHGRRFVGLPDWVACVAFPLQVFRGWPYRALMRLVASVGGPQSVKKWAGWLR